jgi:hypothetical protein
MDYLLKKGIPEEKIKSKVKGQKSKISRSAISERQTEKTLTLRSPNSASLREMKSQIKVKSQRSKVKKARSAISDQRTDLCALQALRLCVIF